MPQTQSHARSLISFRQEVRTFVTLDNGAPPACQSLYRNLCRY